MEPAVLGLYRAILRRGRSKLVFTDKRYFERLVRKEFERTCRTESQFNFQIEVWSYDVSTISLIFFFSSCRKQSTS